MPAHNLSTLIKHEWIAKKKKNETMKSVILLWPHFKFQPKTEEEEVI